MRKTGAALIAVAVALAVSLAACDGSSDDGPESTVPDESPAPATPALLSETPPTTPDPLLPEPPAEPVEPRAPAASPSTDEPTAPASKEAPAPVAEPTPLLYDTYDLSGAVTEPGHYAFLADPDDPTSVVTTYEGLRDGSTTALLIHTHDAHGVSQADLFDAVEPGDLFEWRQDDDCFVRYQVTEVKADPTGTVPQKLLGVAWMTYAFAGCSGAVDVRHVATLDFGDLPALGGTSLTTPLRHGPYQLVPDGWTGVIEPRTVYEPPAYNRDNPRYIQSLAEARQMPYWREPVLPDGTTFWTAAVDPETVIYGYHAAWIPDPQGNGVRVEIYGAHRGGHGAISPAAWFGNDRLLGMNHTAVIAGRPALLTDGSGSPVDVRVYDPATGAAYTIIASTANLWDASGEPRWPITVARSLFEPPNAP